jgi:hypothetical protein
MAFITRITAVVSEIDGWKIHSEVTTIHMTDDWYCKYKPVVGDYLTHNDDGYYAVIPLQAYNAVRQFYHV